ncbi:MAG: hypothetical protein COB66_01410 [Coxiella sp. (in: Bacteria)]|nr:MAG: hypothetical protein COB66_01410 [Coxiella sp. (in: g-proteobacteria)]
MNKQKQKELSTRMQDKLFPKSKERKPASDLQKAASRMNWILGFTVKGISSYNLQLHDAVTPSPSTYEALAAYNLAVYNLKVAVREDYATFKVNIMVGREMEKGSLAALRLEPANTPQLPKLCCCIECNKPFNTGDYFEADISPLSDPTPNWANAVKLDSNFQVRWELHADDYPRRHIDCAYPDIPF